MRYFVSLTVFFMVTVLNLFSMSSVSGYIKDLDKEKPIEGALIFFSRIEKNDVKYICKTKSEHDGFFIIELSPGTFSFSIDFPEIGKYICLTGIVGPEFYDIQIKKNQDINFNVFIKKGKFPEFKKMVSKDGKEIEIRITYHRSLKKN